MIAFDFDGVIADTEKAARHAADVLLAQAGVRHPPLRDRAQVRAAFAVAALAPRLGERGAKTLVAMHPVLMRSAAVGSPLVPGICELLHEIPEEVPVVTAGFASTAECLLAEDRACVGRILGHEHGRKQELMARAAALATQRDERLVYVCDTRRDVDRCRQVDAVSVAVTWGYDTCIELSAWAPDHVVHTVDELAGLLLLTNPDQEVS